MKITAFSDAYPNQIATGSTWLGSTSGSNSGYTGGDVTGEPGLLSVVSLRNTVSLASNMGDNTVGSVLTTVQSSPWTAQFAVPSNSSGSNSLLRTTGGSGGVTTIAASGSATTLMVGGANTFDVTLTANCAISLSGAAATGSESAIVVILRGTDTYTASWPVSVVWAGGSAPTLSGPTDFIVLETVDGGTTWYGFPTGGSTTSTATERRILLADGRSTPFAFTDLLQMDDGSDFMWSD